MTGPILHPTRRGFLIGGAAITLLPRCAATPRSPSLPFVVIGDWGRDGSDDQREVGIQLGKSAEAMGSRFVISTGDNFYEDGVTGLDDPKWRSSFAEIYAAPSLQTPWNVILGNHDYRGSVEAQLAYGMKDPRWRLPARWYRRREDAGGVSADYFYIDTSPFLAMYRNSVVKIEGQDTGAQLAWLEKALAASDAPWKVVVGHHPLYTVNGGDKDNPELIAQVKPLLDRYRVRAYLNGHVHTQQHLVVDGVHYITSGAGSRTEGVPPAGPGQFASDQHGFMVAEHGAEALAFRFLDDRGRTLYQAAVPRAA